MAEHLPQPAPAPWGCTPHSCLIRSSANACSFLPSLWSSAGTEGGAARFKVPGDRESVMHVLPAAPSHQFNQEHTGALSPIAVPAQPETGKGRGIGWETCQPPRRSGQRVLLLPMAQKDLLLLLLTAGAGLGFLISPRLPSLR